jgi:phosphoribosylformimino-5-aminoimidazole carboxamide ribotide isomerase
MEGPNFELYKEVLQKFPNIHLAASGGVRGIDDFKKLREMGLHAVVFGRAFYEGKISLSELEKFIANG